VNAHRLPVPGSDDGKWGEILNDFLQASHNNDGSLLSNAVTAAIPTGSISSAHLDTSTQDTINSAVQSVNGKSGTAVSLSASDVSAVATGSLVLNVKDYGAVGNGTTDDTSAIRAALTAYKASSSAAGTIHLPRGTYRISSQIDLGGCNNLTLSGAGADSSNITCTSAINAAFIATSALSGIIFQDMGWTGGASYPAQVPARNRTFSSSFQHAVQLDGSNVPNESNPIIQNVTFRRCRVSNCASLPVFFRGVSGYTRVVDSFFDNCMDVGLIYCSDVLVSRNRALNGADNGFSISRGCRKVVCTSNKVDGTAYHGVWISGFVLDAGGGNPGAGSDTGPQDFVCTGNLVTNVGRSGICLIDAPKNGVVSGNTVNGVSRGDLNGPSDSYGLGILICGYPSTLPGAPTDYADNLTVTGNTLLNCAKGGIFLKSAVRYSKIESNLIISPGSQFLADGVTSAVSTTDNLNNFGVSADNISTHTTLDVNNNTVIDTRSSGSRWSNFSVSVSTTITNMRAAGNRGINTAEVLRGGNATESFDTYYAAKNYAQLATYVSGIRVGSTAGTTNLFTRIDGAAGNARRFVIGTGSQLDRWAWVGNGTAESGSNAGSDLELRSYNDAGSFLQSVMTISRANGQIAWDDGVNFAFGTSSGTKIGTTTTQKIGFYGVTPTAQPANNTDLKAALASLGLIASGGGNLIATSTPKAPVTGAGTAGSVGTVADAGHQHPSYDWLPGDHGFQAWTFDPALCSASQVLSGGVIQLVKVKIPTAITVASVCAFVGTAGGTLTSGQNYAALYDSSGSLLSATADQTTAWGTTGLKIMALTSSQAVAAGSYVYVALLSNGTTPPAFYRGVSSGIGNANLASGAYRSATSGASQTIIPASITLSGAASSPNQFWVALG
jgi:hypothetical protein